MVLEYLSYRRNLLFHVLEIAHDFSEHEHFQIPLVVPFPCELLPMQLLKFDVTPPRPRIMRTARHPHSPVMIQFLDCTGQRPQRGWVTYLHLT